MSCRECSKTTTLLDRQATSQLGDCSTLISYVNTLSIQHTEDAPSMPTSRFKSHFQMVHPSYIANRVGSSQPRQLTIFALPGELRITIFEYLLLSNSTEWDETTEKNVPYAKCFLGDKFLQDVDDDLLGLCRLQDLASLSLVCHLIRKEARSFFFGMNKFLVTIKGLGRLQQYVRFLEGIRPDGRANLTLLALHRSGGPFRPCSKKVYDELFDLLGGASSSRH